MTLRRLLALLCISIVLVTVLVPAGVPVVLVELAAVVVIAASIPLDEPAAPPFFARIIQPTHLARASLI